MMKQDNKSKKKNILFARVGFNRTTQVVFRTVPHIVTAIIFFVAGFVTHRDGFQWGLLFILAIGFAWSCWIEFDVMKKQFPVKQPAHE